MTSHQDGDRSGFPTWDFGYEALSSDHAVDEGAGTNVVVATRCRVDAALLRAALRGLAEHVDADVVLDRAPLFWTRVRSAGTLSVDAITAALAGAAIDVRYVASATASSLVLPPPLPFGKPREARNPRGPREQSPGEPRGKNRESGWRTRAARPLASRSPETSRGDWFLGDGGGIRIDRDVCGTGAGMRLAVIDDETADLERVELERIVRIGVDDAPATSGHAALMVGWAMGALRPEGPRFVGVAPDASVRVYCIPKPGSDVVSLPTAIARAVFDGADVIV
ncbi:MAG TPA: hypothetical protein VII82_10410, partial [Polyangiaceae bacterium]